MWEEMRDITEEEKFEALTGTAASVMVKEGAKVVAGGGAEERMLDVDGTTAIEVTDVVGFADDVALVDVLRVVAGTGITTDVLAAIDFEEELALALLVGFVFVAPDLNTLRELTFQNESAKAAGLFAT